mgnify:CR=1 FL=1
MNRREFFKGVGAALIVIPILKSLPKIPATNIKEVVKVEKIIGQRGTIYGIYGLVGRKRDKDLFKMLGPAM